MCLKCLLNTIKSCEKKCFSFNMKDKNKRLEKHNAWLWFQFQQQNVTNLMKKKTPFNTTQKQQQK